MGDGRRRLAKIGVAYGFRHSFAYATTPPVTDLPALTAALERLHRVRAYHLRTERVRDADRGRVFWEGHVELFRVEGHRRAEVAFVWCVDTGRGRRTIAVLGVAPIHTALNAVRAAQAVRRMDGPG